MPRPSSRPTPASNRPALRLLPTPSWDPPYDERLGARPPRPLGTAPRPDAEQRELALTFLLSEEVPAVPSSRRLRLLPPADTDDEERAEPGALPDARGWAGRLAVATVEVLAGARPLPQLRRWTSDEVYAQLRRRTSRGRVAERGPDHRPRQARGHPPTRVRAVRVCEPSVGVAEVSVVVDDGRRARALAMRLEGTDGRWRCTELVGP